VNALAGVGSSAHKLATDLRILASRKEMEEPFEAEQIGSSAMAYKRNPMRSERICSLARFLMTLPISAAETHANQWMERTLDDSANRRIVLPQAFLAADAILLLVANVARGLVVYPAVVAKHLRAELPFMITENVLMEAVAAGGDRQTLHERIRVHSQAVAEVVKQQGGENDLMSRLAKDDAFAGVDLDKLADPAALTGRSSEQVDQFLAEVVEPIRHRYGAQADDESLRV
jgi:adenylosuccinate lyase